MRFSNISSLVVGRWIRWADQFKISIIAIPSPYQYWTDDGVLRSILEFQILS